MNPKLRAKTTEALSAVLPITGIVFAISILLIPLELGAVVMFMTGALLLVLGMGFFQLGAEVSMTPLGEGIGAELSKSKRVFLIALVALLMGVIITAAEPDLQVLAEQVPFVSNLTLVLTVAVGVGVFLAAAVLRILFKASLSALLIGMYALLIGLSFFVPENFIAVAFDSGGVTTGPITVPFIMALGVGLAGSRSGQRAQDDSFGLVALSSGGPILAVLLLGRFFSPGGAAYTPASLAEVLTMRDVVREFAIALPRYFKEVFISVAPILAVLFVFQLISRRYRPRQLRRILVGFGYTYLGLVLFLCGVNVGFAPVGTLLGRELAGLSRSWLLVPIGMLIGYFIVKAEPAIQVLNHQIQSVTDGAVSEKAMNLCLSIGVSVSVGLSMLRVLTGLPLFWIVIPGYVIALALSRLVPKMFVGIAFDSGGVASGPMTTTFLLPLSIGACEAAGGSIMADAFGVVALVALTPLIAVQIMGLGYGLKLGRLARAARLAAIPDDSDDIIDFEEGAAA